MTGSVKKHLKQALPALLILLAMVLLTSIVSPKFRTLPNLRNVATQATVVAVVAIAQTSVLLIGGIDMSVSSVISMSTILMAMFSANSGLGLLGSIVLSLAMGAFVGLVNGIGVVKFKIPAMIITISTQAFLKGICLILMPSSGGKVNMGFQMFMKQKMGVLTTASLTALLLYIAFFVMFHYTRFGRGIYAIGNGETYASQSGIKTGKTIIGVYMMAGMMAAVAGVLLSARIATGNPLVGDSYAMDSVAAAVVGGISMNGGVGTVFGALAGAMILSLINNIMNNVGISPYYQYIIKGLILVLSLLIFQLKRRRKNGAN